MTLRSSQDRGASWGVGLGALLAFAALALPASSGAYPVPVGLTGPTGYAGPAGDVCPARPGSYGGPDDAAVYGAYLAQEAADGCIVAQQNAAALVSTLGDTGSRVQAHADAGRIVAAVAAGATGPTVVTLSDYSQTAADGNTGVLHGDVWFALGLAVMLWFGTKLVKYLMP